MFCKQLAYYELIRENPDVLLMFTKFNCLLKLIKQQNTGWNYETKKTGFIIVQKCFIRTCNITKSKHNVKKAKDWKKKNI